MNTYKQLSATSIQRQSDYACIPIDPANSDYQQFLKDQAVSATSYYAVILESAEL